jgi:hypothetical protein
MATINWQPRWWTEQTHGSMWSRVREAMKRDWEQTKSDLGIGGGHQRDGRNDGSAARSATWSDVETPLAYGYCARQEFGAEHQSWNERLENALRTEWEKDGNPHRSRWNEIKAIVRRGYEQAARR